MRDSRHFSLPYIRPEPLFSRNKCFENPPLHQTLVPDSKAQPNSEPNGQYTRSFSFLFRFFLSPQLKFCLPNRKYWINLLKYIYFLICYTIVFTSSSPCFWISLPFTYILHKSCSHSFQLGLQLKDRVPHSTCLRHQNRTLWRRTNLDIRDAPGKISHVSQAFKGTEGILV